MKLDWMLGYTKTADAVPAEIFPASVPGGAQSDYAKFKGMPPFYFGVNFRDWAWMEDVYWHYTAKLDFSLTEGQTAELVFKGIDYQYRITAGGDLLCEGEGMFSDVRVDVTKYAGETVEVLIYPSPKADDSGDRNQARMSCKAAACYEWDWHPRLLTAGLWDEAEVVIHDPVSVRAIECSYRLSDDLDCCGLHADVSVTADCAVTLQLMDGEEVVCENAVAAVNGIASADMTLENPKLWWPVGYGEQHRYTLRAKAGESVLDRKVGFRRSKMVMNQGSWIEPTRFPKSRSDAPATLEINGRRIFAKGSNWVNAQVFPGEMTEEHYRSLLTLVKEANMNILRIWGGGFVNKEVFFDLCDEMGIMIWQEFPLSCNEYPDDDHYLSVLEKEAAAIVRKLRSHPCVVLWCGGNELFNNWSLMTDQHHALRLLDKVCYTEDRFTPFIMTSPLNGMGHGHYVNYDETTGEETITVLRHAYNTAYTEFGAPGAADADYIRKYCTPEDYADCRAENEVWTAHHAFGAWQNQTWLRGPEADYYFGGYADLEDLIEKTRFIQSMSYKSYFEEMRKQWPHCSMALNWCLNEPWPTFANNSIIAWPDIPKPCYEAVKDALRPQLVSLRIDRHLWRGGETFHADIWLMNDSIDEIPAGRVTAYYALGDGEMTEWGELKAAALPAQQNRHLGGIDIALPEDFDGFIRVELKAEGRPGMDSSYSYPCRRKAAGPAKKILNL
ncbi:MAG: hypothetical protein IKM31_04625 [Oscillospiraceae bacterium]|nr:hypothetical protein [Oscillospiraceae bacterium]